MPTVQLQRNFCTYFQFYLKNNVQLLHKILSTEKYEWANEKEDQLQKWKQTVH
jgi:hypothetical protein